MKAFAALALLVPFVGCASPSATDVADSPGGCKGICAHGTAATRGVGPTGGSGSSGGGASTSGGTQPNGSGGNTTTGGAIGSSLGNGSTGGSGASSSFDGTDLYECPGRGPPPDDAGCPSGSLASLAVDVLTCQPLPAATVQTLDVNGVPQPGAVDVAADGTFALCGPASGAFTAFIEAAGYETTYLPELRAAHPSTYDICGILSTSFLLAVGGLLPGGLDTSKGTLVAYLSEDVECSDSAGYVVTLTDTDGGAIADGGYLRAYLGPSGVPESSLTATSAEGLAIFYDIDLSQMSYFGVTAFNPAAGSCAPVIGSAVTTGRIYIAPGSVSLYIFQRP